MGFRILVIEFDYHAEVLANLIEILRGSQVKLSILTKEKIWSKVGIAEQNLPQEFKVYQKKESESIGVFMDRYLDEINSCNLIYFNTLASNYKFFSKLKFSKPSILRIHNANTYFDTYRNISLGISDFGYNLRHILGKSIGKLDWYYRAKCVRNIDYYNFPNSVVTDYVISNKLVDQTKISEPFPCITYHSETEQISKTDFVQITVIGTVEKKRRDYDLLIKALGRALPSINERVKVVLLGKLKGGYGKAINTQLETLSSNHKNLEVITYLEFVDQSEFDRQMALTNFLIVPIKLKTRYQIYKEVYGESKISGNENDMIRYSKAAIIPEGYQVPGRISSLAAHYSTADELSNLIISWVNDSLYKTRVQEADLAYYSKENMAKTFIRICEKALAR